MSTQEPIKPVYLSRKLIAKPVYFSQADLDEVAQIEAGIHDAIDAKIARVSAVLQPMPSRLACLRINTLPEPQRQLMLTLFTNAA